jgi:predicted hotdog family 3-hydroxylacyl-ACP dehydratase
MVREEISPRDVLPHGPTLQLLRDGGRKIEGWFEFEVELQSTLCVVESDGTVSPEVGLEVMAQACGVAMAHPGDGAFAPKRIGFVAAVRGYEYRLEPFVVGQLIRARVRPEMCEESLIVCEAELFVDGEDVARQRARITLVLKEG